ncbi:hypothetical protein [Escherichia coli]|uniref:hypothetical protein n=1 Tax=Escherichia coli TaxID=562 RepID=UPI000DA45D3A|nr:hypothetical protein [Escherichia coli]SQS47053.1 Uncharacterised protein [Escherichia coli]
MNAEQKHTGRRPGKSTRYCIAILRNLLMSEIDDLVAEMEIPGGPTTPGEIHRDPKQRIDNAIDCVLNPTE